MKKLELWSEDRQTLVMKEGRYLSCPDGNVEKLLCLKHTFIQPSKEKTYE